MEPTVPRQTRQGSLIPSETLIDERRDVTISQKLRLSPTSSGFQVEGPGMIDTVVIRGDSSDYAVEIETDSAVLIRDNWTALNTLSDDLTHISAYQDSGDSIVVVQDYPYREYSTVAIDPGSEMTFERIRAEWIVGVPVAY